MERSSNFPPRKCNQDRKAKISRHPNTTQTRLNKVNEAKDKHQSWAALPLPLFQRVSHSIQIGNMDADSKEPVKYTNITLRTMPQALYELGRVCIGVPGLILFGEPTLHSGATPLLRGFSRKIYFVKKYLITSLVFKLQKWFLHQNGVEFSKKSKSDLTKLWPVVGRQLEAQNMQKRCSYS